jgi:hypothetical protein
MTVDDIKNICHKYYIPFYTINDDLSIDVPNSVFISNYRLTKLPLNFRYVTGSFSCDNNNLTNLEGAPEVVSGFINCSRNKLSDFSFFPKTIDGHLNCTFNDIRDIYNIPKVEKWIIINNNPVHILIQKFINRDDRDNWIEFFNDCDIIRDDHIIWDRLEFFYDYLDIDIKYLRPSILRFYKII